MRIALGIEYDGQQFCGWQKQPQRRAIQSTLDQAVSMIAGESVHTVCAGRTDTAVHALAQVVHFDTNAQRPEQAWVRGVNSHLPEDISVLWARVVDEGFHARFSALSRTYHYWLYPHSVRPAIAAHYVGWIHTPLNVDNMHRAMSYLQGEHDFSAFRSSECQAKTATRTMYEAYLVRHGVLIQLVFKANAFLHHMVRNLVGSLVDIGQGRHESEWMNTLIEQKNRTLAAPTFSPQGLYLSQIEYAEHWQLPQTQCRPYFFVNEP
ncbi:MAG: tRNA pseudouridine(38-40) synthase [Ferrovum sp. 37-45-19]|jgi:tRNA pseudouridine38-40 synthase|uniref:tRNA pseudouridine(38-40) synthase TruA n=1 Tax=Ferrovum sp. JA12 TaxID=1356299 RepID=UPI0007029E6A|nr:tRNA pseudouridine(38-40) synthase TruA [Ferrovum sp. JA12]OYV80246.1 MAG: tRNA pseudouridine(38-40) synthase [Ferrovum sp. 21-44-67]OYV94523.1 MAG: tRNA pseudouridine(38-40) synthase [Ferrovum sp. 37-45-19]OZB33859.1 MAG: tRNA pseudouridine(38-40) synthase [Ferrovum sp. 34-44-207]HQT81577.1 tRNA pseudouridine(38-40) synthase TruA [Ferrovaceae bacterium]KRH78928.1 tRNA pseudouridine synthase A [Ferrovum sp. JA12]